MCVDTFISKVSRSSLTWINLLPPHSFLQMKQTSPYAIFFHMLNLSVSCVLFHYYNELWNFISLLGIKSIAFLRLLLLSPLTRRSKSLLGLWSIFLLDIFLGFCFLGFSRFFLFLFGLSSSSSWSLSLQMCVQSQLKLNSLSSL